MSEELKKYWKECDEEQNKCLSNGFLVSVCCSPCSKEQQRYCQKAIVES
jgi:hypothetical protein